MITCQQVTFGCGHTATTANESMIMDALLGVYCPACLRAMGQSSNVEESEG